MNVEKLENLILFLDTFEKQGFIDMAPTDCFDRKVREWLIGARLASYFAGHPPELCWIYGPEEEAISELKHLLEEILGETSESLWKKESSREVET
nr:hypothetical protein [Candidatus Freyarchaeota archaeon]